MDGRDMLAGRYELRGILGRGGMAEVHDGWDTRLNRAVAIKLLYPAFIGDAELRRRFEDEARAAAALNHPNIVSVHDCGDHDGTPFIVMERLPGRTLADEIAMGPMPPQRLRAMLSDVLGALGAAHAAGIVHRDIKPGNVLIDASGNTMKVADFGIAKTAGAAHTATGQIVGTMAYMSPERVAGAPASVADDVYAVGVMGYEALAGLRPFPQENPAALIRAILDSRPPPIAAVRPDVDPRLAAVVDRAMAPASGRFRSADEMRSALEGNQQALFSAVGPRAAPRPPTKVLADPIAPSANYFVPGPVRRRTPMSRERKLLLAAAAFVGMVVATLALAVDPSPTSPPTQPIGTSTTVSPPPTTTPPTSAVPVFDEPKDEKKDEKKGEKKQEGRGNGNEGGGNGDEGNRGNGNKKRDGRLNPAR